MAKVWKDYPNTTTPLTAAELNRIENTLETALQPAALTNAVATLNAAITAVDNKIPVNVPWTNLTLSAGWSAVSGHIPQACIKAGVVYIRGAVAGASTSSWTTIATLPANMRPAAQQFLGLALVTAASGVPTVAELFCGINGVIQVPTGYTTSVATTISALPLVSCFAL